jgi:predicted ATPase
VLQVLAFVEEEQLLIFSDESGRWEFDLCELQHQTMVPDSLAEILERRIYRLPPPTMEALMIASLVGFAFEEMVVADVNMRLVEHQQTVQPSHLEEVPSVVKEALILAEQEGFIEKSVTEGHYVFSHDKLLSSFWE